VTQRSWTHLSRSRMAEILEQNAQAFDRHTDQLQMMQRDHKTRMAKLAAHDARLDAHAEILLRGFWGRLMWIVFGW